ncbi:GNAT family N-acetyltransferase [Brevibacillus humidisoli]|uniref:GNAT family N-acetyltransferase n=1 Tax=Brevibacillus humidisoli TaxID=2895522 RepID=UPI001E585B4F|nr:GNAT family N-acetyltransferase [Brevibacillus humidisoli]UFJ41506.1 GNAT family N-acetyltransferase [Brevibacillus humidisoli]
MNLLTLTPSQVERNRHLLLKFIRQHGDNRITRRAVHWLKTVRLDPREDGTRILVALDEKKLVGLFAVAAYGLKEAFLVIHRDCRSMGMGRQLSEAMQQLLPKLYVRVALDHAASLRCFMHSGFVGVKLFDGPTGKPTLYLAAGEWSKADLAGCSSESGISDQDDLFAKSIRLP